MKRFRRIIAHYFSLSPKETKGFMLLASFLMLLVCLPPLYRLFFFAQQLPHPADQKILDSLLNDHSENIAEKSMYGEKEATTIHPIAYHPFDPNTDSQSQLEQAGVPPHLAARIIKFRSKGGFFRTPQDLLKIYGMDEALYKHLEASVRIPQKTPLHTKHTTTQSPRQQKTVAPFDLNLADSAQLCRLKGIGAARSKRIIRYRQLLGGFVHLQQLQEVYGLDSISLQQLEQHTYIDPDFVPHKTNINTSDPLSHPYLDKKTAQHIRQYRLQHGDYTSAAQLQNIKTMDQKTYEKIIPYLSFD
jgi:competence protein ComEA